MSDLVVALVGGAVGSVITAVIGQAARARVAWSDVELHDAEAAERNAQLLAWVDDRTLKLVREMQAITEEHASRGAFHSSIHATALADAKARALHEFRDAEWSARIDLTRLGANEAFWHAAWRLLRRRPVPGLTAKDEAEPFLIRWREPITRHAAGPSDSVTPLDRTRRTTAEALTELEALPLT